MSENVRHIELLAPAKDAQSGIVAIDYGADAVYIGAPMFGARRGATNSVENIARLAEYAHRFGVGVHVAMNTILYENEVAQAEQIAREVIEAGADALIVQDMAYTRMNLQNVELHASTQMFNMEAGHVKFLHDVGFSRVVLERALSIDDIRTIRAVTKGGLEAFVHGAICVGYSGRCYMSRTVGERSGNRGDCMQACRLSYDLTDGNGRKYMQGKHLLSVRDLNLSARVEEMIEAGVDMFKIEGRLKDLSYVKNIVAYYRQTIDRAISERADCRRSSIGHTEYDFEADPSRSFTRGESEYFLDGARAGVASFDTPKAIGQFIGRVTRVSRDVFEYSGDIKLVAGDGVCFRGRCGIVGTKSNRVDGCEVEPNWTEGIAIGDDGIRNRYHAYETQLV